MMRHSLKTLLLIQPLILFCLPGQVVSAGEADILAVNMSATGDRVYRIDVTVAHKDTGWDHYANQWEVRTLDGKSLGIRRLAHPHVSEQPFTRSLGGVSIPAGIDQVELRARDSEHDYGGKIMIVKVPN